MVTGDSEAPKPVPEYWTPDAVVTSLSAPYVPGQEPEEGNPTPDPDPTPEDGRKRYRHAAPRPVKQRRKRRLPTVVAVMFWLVLAGLAVVALVRIVAWDEYQPFIVLNDLTAFVYLPAWIIAVVALLGRRFVLAGAALVIVVVQVLLMAPELTATAPVPDWTSGAPSIRVLDANVYDLNPSMAGYIAQIKQDQPDLVTFEEATPADVVQLRSSTALRHLTYQYEVSRTDPTAFFIASRYPIVAPKTASLFGRPLFVEVTVQLPSGPLPVWVVHTVAPLPSSYQQWKDQLRVISYLLGKQGTKGLLVIGDFNGTWDSKGFRGVLDTGLSDGAAARGQPFAMTWSQTMFAVPPLVRVDHVLTGPGVAVTKLALGVGVGSDHRDLFATVAVDRAHSS